jgi:Ser/Thr protein kinase RdoA (MazF antagonist)
MNHSELVTDIASSLYGHEPRIQRLVSHNNLVFLLDFRGILPNKVLKMSGSRPMAAKRVLGEQQALRVLHQAGLPVPEVEFTQDDGTTTHVPFFTMPQIPGETLEATWSNPPAWEQEAWKRAGRFVAQLRHVQIQEVHEIITPPWNAFDNVRIIFEKHGFLRPPFTHILDEAEDLKGHDDQCFIHGDYGPSQIITNGDAFCVVDWEAPTTGSLLDALGRIIAMTREYGGQDRHIQWLINGFEEVEPLSQAQIHELHIREMMNHVGVMSWKLGWFPDHDQHARDMAVRVEHWTYF